jgi:hypothetical protein
MKSVGRSIFGGVILLLSAGTAFSADTCVVIKGGKKMCGTAMNGGVFSKTDHGWCFIYKKGVYGQHVDCNNPAKKLGNGNL